MSTSRTVLPPNNAAAYVRMSTEHQQYSTSNQMDVIREYAKRRGLEIVMLYSDEGKSGLNIQGRDSLAQMLKDVQSARAAILLHSGVRCQPMGPVPGCRRKRLLRVHLPAGGSLGPLLRGAVRKRRESDFHNSQGRQARHGG